MAKNRANLAAAKQRKQKIVAIVGLVLLAAVLVFQVPRTMRMLDSGAEQAAPPPPAEAQQSPSGAAGSPAPTGDTASAPVSAAPTAGAQGGLVDSDVAPEPD